MPTIKDVCRHIRSKNAGPFWVTFDLFFPDRDACERYAKSPQLQPDAIGKLFDVDPDLVKRFIDLNLSVLKISCPRAHPQGGIVDRDLHQGQQYVRLLDVVL
jgi:hypothetical protein